MNTCFGEKEMFNGSALDVERSKPTVRLGLFPALNLCAVAELRAVGRKKELAAASRMPGSETEIIALSRSDSLQQSALELGGFGDTMQNLGCRPLPSMRPFRSTEGAS